MFVDLPAVRPGRLSAALAAEDLTEQVREFRDLLRGARAEELPAGVRLVVQLDVPGLARLAELVRSEADALPFWSFRVLADPPVCWLEVTGVGQAGRMARAVFGGMAG